MPREIDSLFPNLADSDYEITEEASERYNCIAWALGITSQPWDCFDPDGYWPESLPRNHWLPTIVRLFAQQGFEICEQDSIDPGFEKIALYAFIGKFTHVARQLNDGQWTSKLGNLETITHSSSLQDISGGTYGSVHCIMRRPIATT